MTIWGWIGFGRDRLPRRAAGGAGRTCSRRRRSTGARPFTRVLAHHRCRCCVPPALFLLVWLTINALQLFDEVYVTTKGGPLHATTVVVYYLYHQAFVSSSTPGTPPPSRVVLFVVDRRLSPSIQLRLARKYVHYSMTTSTSTAEITPRVDEPDAPPACACPQRLAPRPGAARLADGRAAALDARDQPVDARARPAASRRCCLPPALAANYVAGLERLAVRHLASSTARSSSLDVRRQQPGACAAWPATPSPGCGSPAAASSFLAPGDADGAVPGRDDPDLPDREGTRLAYLGSTTCRRPDRCPTWRPPSASSSCGSSSRRCRSSSRRPRASTGPAAADPVQASCCR